MQAEVLAIGDELISGQRLDTNSRWLSQQLGDLGIRVVYQTSVGDDQACLVEALRTTARRSHLAVLTGGLGPTADDITRQALAETAGCELQLNRSVLEQIERRFAQRGRTMTPNNQVQAQFPTGSRIIENPHGTAPGIDLEVVSSQEHRCRFFALPGVPAEMRQMWQQFVRPIVESIRGPGRSILHHRLKCFGVGESELEAMLPDLIRRGRQPQVGITVHQATITLRVTAEGADRQQCWQAMQPTLDVIREKLGTLVFGQEDDELQHAVIRHLRDRRQTVAVCECGTQGLVAHWLQSADDPQSPCVQAAIILPSAQGLDRLLNQSPGGARDELGEIAAHLAQAVRDRGDADYGLAIGELPDTAAARPQIPFALAGPDRVEVCFRTYAGHPDILRARTAKQALDLLRLRLVLGPTRMSGISK